MTVDNGTSKANHDSSSISSGWAPGDLGRIGEDEISRASRDGLGNGATSNGKDAGVELSEAGLPKSREDVEAENGSSSLRDLLSTDYSADVESTDESTKPRGKRGRAKKGAKEFAPDNQPELGSWSFRNLLGSYRSRESESDALPTSSPSPGRKTRNGTRVESNTSSPLRHGSPVPQGSPLRQGSPLVIKKLLTPSISFARIKEEKDEMSRMVPTPEELTLRDGITLPLIGQVKWEELKKQAIKWLKNPKNLVLLVWIIAVAVSGAILFMVMVGMLNAVLPRKSDRDLWFEISNQILNALFTLMALYNHPIRILHLVYLIRYKPADIIKLREKYCKNGQRKPHEWTHILVVVLLLHLNCIAQYALCGLNWGYRRANRPAIGVAITLLLSFGAAAAAGIYNTLSPLGKDYHGEDDEPAAHDDLIEKMEKAEPAGHSSSIHPAVFKLHNPKYKMLEKSKSFACKEGRPVMVPQWEGGLFDCHEEPTIGILSILCFPCVMGFNYERLGFGNRYVHVVTFLLLVGAPYLVFNLAAININNSYVRTSLGVTGYVLCIFSLLYGGFWRIKIRERYKLPAHTWCCKSPNATDCFQWLFCSFCSLCQEVRTAEAYDVRNDTFFVRSIHRAHTPGSPPDSGMRDNTEPVPASFIQPLPSSPMVHYKDGDLLHEKPVDLTMLFPPPDQTIDSVSPLQSHGKSPNRSHPASPLRTHHESPNRSHPASPPQAHH
ncbi:hypothetical protein M758_6G037600 [Ceratodon purpureus]|nr:hypothetical protein M758_6G037600 [Ceratodon purpureus]